jgi:ABC-type nitrate/sulfonate/bicarbonate transport system permease component
MGITNDMAIKILAGFGLGILVGLILSIIMVWLVFSSD